MIPAGGSEPVQTNPVKRDCHRLPQPEKSRNPQRKADLGAAGTHSSLRHFTKISILIFPPAGRLLLLLRTAYLEHLHSLLQLDRSLSFSLRFFHPLTAVLDSSLSRRIRAILNQSPCRPPVLVFASSRTPELLSATHMALSVGLVPRASASRAPMLRPLSNRALSSVYGTARSV